MVCFVFFDICQQSLRAVEKKRPRTERRRMEHDGKWVTMQTLEETTWRYLPAIPTCCRENRRTEKTNTRIMKTIHNVWEDVMNGDVT